MDSLIFLSGKAVFSTAQQPGSALVAPTTGRGDLLGPKVANASRSPSWSESPGSRYSERELKTGTAEGQVSSQQQHQWDFSVSTVASPSLFLSSPLSWTMLGWPHCFWLKTKAPLPLQHHFDPPPLLSFSAISANGHTRGSFILGFFALVHH